MDSSRARKKENQLAVDAKQNRGMDIYQKSFDEYCEDSKSRILNDNLDSVDIWPTKTPDKKSPISHLKNISLSVSSKNINPLTVNLISTTKSQKNANEKKFSTLNNDENASVIMSDQFKRSSLYMSEKSQDIKIKKKIDFDINSEKENDNDNEDYFNKLDIASQRSVKTNDHIKSVKSDLTELNPDTNRHLKPKASLNQLRRKTYIIHRISVNGQQVCQKRQSNAEFMILQRAIKSSFQLSLFNEYTIKLRKSEIALGILSIINIIISIIDTQLFINRQEIEKEEIISHGLPPIETTLRAIMMIISVGMGVLVYFRYICVINLKIADSLLTKNDNLVSSNLLLNFLVEIMISIIFYPPGFAYVYHGTINEYHFEIVINAIFSLLTIIKIYHAFRIYKYFSKFTDFDAVSICNKYEVRNYSLFSIKAETKSRPFIILTIIFFFFILLMSFSLRTFENGIVIIDGYVKPSNSFIEGDNYTSSSIPGKGTQNLSFILNSMWLILQTVTTVGYGDAFPKTHFGRAVASAACIFGIFIISMISASISPHIDFTPEEKKSYIVLKQMNLERLERHKAHAVIMSLFELNKSAKTRKLPASREQKHNQSSDQHTQKESSPRKKANKALVMSSKSIRHILNNHGHHSHKDKEKQEKISRLTRQFIIMTTLKKNITNFRLENKSSTKSVPLDELLQKMRKKLKEDLVRLEHNVSLVGELDSQFQEMKQIHSQTSKTLKSIVVKQTQILHYMLINHNRKLSQNLMSKLHPSLQKSKKSFYNKPDKPNSTDLEKGKLSIKEKYNQSFLFPKERFYSPCNRKSKLSIKSELAYFSESEISKGEDEGLKENEKTQHKRKHSQAHTYKHANSSFFKSVYGGTILNLLEEVGRNIDSQLSVSPDSKNLNFNVNVNLNVQTISQHYYQTSEYGSSNNLAPLIENRKGKRSILKKQV